MTTEIACYASACDAADFCSNLLDGNHQRKAENKSPAKTVAKLRANLAVRSYPARVVICSACNQPWPQSAEKFSDSAPSPWTG